MAPNWRQAPPGSPFAVLALQFPRLYPLALAGHIIQSTSHWCRKQTEELGERTGLEVEMIVHPQPGVVPPGDRDLNQATILHVEKLAEMFCVETCTIWHGEGTGGELRFLKVDFWTYQYNEDDASSESSTRVPGD